ncbi:dehydrogenase [Rhodococcus sp. 06-156-3C]|uniref:molybdopterin-dependent oxidoreductase n=1 Tax=Nocardiaceae TaxID=85025 RepID=UPI000522F01B|nr:MULTISPECIES: molybdopterin-dependent oxidoreductase [Rhodococcus]OZD06769.1 dehydrogenase [Rhodococcus sp. 06-156-4C]OZD20491.1 dehydrogenase [Rhodococcus sp. 06-156-3C]OZD27626.1 dehydrogenase [Rhodococcus sp. 06-156-4a]OZD35740.1 dehydrogenase [Rhodococcus sp. 06-156-3b]OZD41322.1 dehydrogenase [Rhodococcus sp. 06-156-3]
MTVEFGTCNLCEAMCGLEFTVDDNAVTSIRGDKKDPLSRGHICPKALSLIDLHADPDRLIKPVRRTDSGWQEIEWDEAYRIVVDGLVSTRRDHGANAVGIYQGNPNVHSLGAMTHGIPFTAMLRTRNRYSATSLDQLPHQLVNHLMYGHQLVLPIPDIDRTDFFLVLGGNPMASNGSMMTVPDFAQRVRDLKARGGTLVVVDPRRTETADVADEHHFVRPGTDALLLLALVNVVLETGATRVADYVDGVSEIASLVRDFTPEAVAPVVGMAAEAIDDLATRFAGAESAVAYGRMGVSTQKFGTVCQWAIQVLNIVTGNLDRVGGALLTDPAIDLVERKIVGRGHFDKWRSRVRDLPEFAGEFPSSTLVDEMTTPGDGRIRAMAVFSGNPVLSMPGGDTLDRAFADLDFMVSFDFYINETSRHADVILPPTMSLERDHYDLIFSTFAVRNTAKFMPAVLPKKPGAKADWEIFRDLGIRYQAALEQSPVDRVRRRLSPKSIVAEARLRLSPRRTVDVLLRSGRKGLSVRALSKSPHGTDLGPLRPGLPAKLRTRDKRIQLVQDVVVGDLPAVHDMLTTASVPADGQLLMIGRRHLRSNNSWMHNTARLTKGKPRHQLLAHPDDLRARGIGDGALVTVTSAAGSVSIEVLASDRMMPGVVSMPHGFGHQRTGVELSVASTVKGPSVNDITDPQQVDAVSANAVLNGIPVTIAAV